MVDHTCFKCDFFDHQDILSITGNIVEIPVCSRGRAETKKLALGKCENFCHTDYLGQAESEIKVRFYGDKK